MLANPLNIIPIKILFTKCATFTRLSMPDICLNFVVLTQFFLMIDLYFQNLLLTKYESKPPEQYSLITLLYEMCYFHHTILYMPVDVGVNQTPFKD